MHSGRLTASSPGEGCGSVFVCELPVLRLKKHAAVDVEKGGGTGDSGIELTHRSDDSTGDADTFCTRMDQHLAQQSVFGAVSPAASHVASLGLLIPSYESSKKMSPPHFNLKEESCNEVDTPASNFIVSPRSAQQHITLLQNTSSLELCGALATPKSKARATAGKSREDMKRVLVVDDAAPSRKMLLRWLQNAGYLCYSAVDGQDCLDVVDRLMQEHRKGAGAIPSPTTEAASAKSLLSSSPIQPLDFIFMDFEMPRMNGPDATLALRKRGITVPIIGVTGNVLPADKEHFLKHGATSVFHKPLDLVQLKEEMLRHFTQY
jgi:CheY-like chemotaxis protein